MWASGKGYPAEGMAHAKAEVGLSVVVFEEHLEGPSVVEQREGR